MLPEIDKDQVGGTVTETKSSDSYIERVVTSLKSDVYGLNDEVVDVGQSEVYAPHKMVSDAAESGTERSLSLIEPAQGTRKMTYRNSAFGSSILNRRKLKKAA